ncbi:hypothetical protein PUW79_07690 [Microbacterium sp. NE2HP2]|uniref:Uncharacterized membrane protein YhaH (DUF805 family) n=3 Tax=Microbacterium TaxID=33882 RepID=A0ABU1I6U7_9MICO|nr:MULTISPECIES: hypothetical protein [Microbacterium]MDF2917203.1 hypothetical protein [Microbacterium sp.]APF34006.1 hypothetical protein BO218_07250 [Microbacterium paludicola]MCZ4067608.1 hypothetical protein [Microbacterium sp. H37-C3]MDD7944509.1 hypothetical protein [Microbacterium plantarum]MDR6168709.1 uncharacterized membrane protein YhaH (DUF805 family) [Microbacterium paludicola]
MRTFWTVVGVIAAIFVAWVIVDIVLRLAVFAVKLGLVAVVALVVFLLLRRLFARSSDQTP